MVDAYVPRMAACISDSNELVRRHCLSLITTLLRSHTAVGGDGDGVTV